MRYYIIAGERSGDLHGGNLVKSIKQRDLNAEFRGFGGEYMEAAGVQLAVHYKEMAIMGLFELLTNMNKIAKFIKRCKVDIDQYNPDVIILIDYGGFNLQIAKHGKRTGKLVYFYIPPKYWAWYSKRAKWLKPHVDRLFVILPFEKDFFKRYDWEAHYVGNPVLDAVKAHRSNDDFLAKHNFTDPGKLIALLPGSRKQELQTIIPLMAQVVKYFPQYHFGLAAVNNLDRSMYEAVSQYSNVTFVLEDTYNLLEHAKAAIVTSGTATLETALFKVPQIVVYKANKISYWLAKKLISVQFISLVNLIAGKEVVKEMIQHEANVESVSLELEKMMTNAAYRERMVDEYEEIIRILDTGSASENAATLMLDFLKQDLKK
ncbi:lipid-A-disaccharide synthase [Pseudochryseolinea flava]|uniref:Lipid-A-disaccharide synthase n=1 Tax=Pseudochryseolinea flava TaxID=2059302 RepID=A0A364XZV8_9BACT|nr:lipid-A-disaccharide synthase [Pseudochryseolinea flava]RAV99914.1 lipid-A-disaccharide synthase [Pseudochryseolinea flava]